MTVDTDDISSLPVSISGLRCRSGVHCTMQANIDAQNVVWRDYTFADITVATALTTNTSDAISVAIPPGLSTELRGISTDGLEIEGLAVTGFFVRRTNRCYSNSTCIVLLRLRSKTGLRKSNRVSEGI